MWLSSHYITTGSYEEKKPSSDIFVTIIVLILKRHREMDRTMYAVHRFLEERWVNWGRLKRNCVHFKWQMVGFIYLSPILSELRTSMKFCLFTSNNSTSLRTQRGRLGWKRELSKGQLYRQVGTWTPISPVPSSTSTTIWRWHSEPNFLLWFFFKHYLYIILNLFG